MIARQQPTAVGHVIVGGGLAGGLVALALANQRRGDEVVLIERDVRLGGNHTWSFHDTDLDAQGQALIQPLVTSRWPSQEVRFPGHQRTLRAGYASVTAEGFHQVVTKRLRAAGARLLLGHAVSDVGRSVVRLDDGTKVAGDVVIDARGPEAGETSDRLGFQKFVGLELELRADGPWTQPVVMDATVPQLDGYRFIYVLPFTRRRVLIEDTMYSRSPVMDSAAVEQRVMSYAAAHGAIVDRVVRRETGVLPLPLRSSRGTGSDTSPIPVGYRGGFFHPVTGYSLPLAVRVALAVAGARTRAEAVTAIGRMSRRLEPQRRFGRLLNRLMFEAMPAAERWTALERFYRMPEPTIARFYASRSTLWDRARMLLGRPPRGISWRRLVAPQRAEI